MTWLWPPSLIAGFFHSTFHHLLGQTWQAALVAAVTKAQRYNRAHIAQHVEETLARRIRALEEAARSFPHSGTLLELLASLDRAEIRDPELLTRFHDTLLFLCAYPASPRVLRRAESILKRFGTRMQYVDPLLDAEVSGVAGTEIDATFTFDFVRWLASRFPRDVDIDWDLPPDDDRLGAVLTTILPSLAEVGVDANVPYFAFLKKLGGLRWLLRELRSPELYDCIGLWISWKVRGSMTRTLMRRPRRGVFYQTAPLLSRRDVSIERVLAGPRLPICTLSPREGKAALDMARGALATRYREVHCFTYGDPSTIVSADCGRGIEIVLIGIERARRLPLRAGFAPMIFRNGIPIGYADAYGLCDLMQVSFNIFYAFRDGEAAYCFAQLLKLYHQLFGSTTFSLDPYQIGLGNDEAIDAGAFWFYRKLGFRSTDAAIERIVRREEQRIARDPRHRTSAHTLKRIAESPMIFGSRDWDRFDIRNVALQLPRALALIPPKIARAKRGRSEARYLRMLAHDARLRHALIAIGSRRTMRARFTENR